MRITFFFTSLSAFLLLTSCENSHDSEQSKEATSEVDTKKFDADASITQKIREKISKDKDLSFKAKNIKILTIDGVVTLTGPVDKPEDKERLLDHAQEETEKSPIVDEIEVIVIESTKPA